MKMYIKKKPNNNKKQLGFINDYCRTMESIQCTIEGPTNMTSDLSPNPPAVFDR